MPGKHSLAFCFMGLIARTILIIVVAAGLFLKVSEAVVPPSTLIETESQAQSERQKLIGIVEKLERHEEENIHFIRELKHDLQGLKA